MAQRSQVPKFGNWESEENVPYTVYFDKARKSRAGGKTNPNDPQDNSNLPPVQPLPLQQDAEQKGDKGPEAVKSKHEPHMSREDSDLRRPSDSPLHPYTVGQKAVIDSSHQLHGGLSSASKSESEAPNDPDALRPRHERHLNREDGDIRRPAGSPLRPDTTSQRATVDSPHHRHGGINNSDTPRKVTRHSVGSDCSIEHSPLHPHYQTRVGGKGSGVSSPLRERKGFI
ncbi:hypothetical protein F0562_000066 [Nyssa sinensis]|uniref:RIN4 pathogenic type III effector avirulence factor Avr cleavage site domain-containing protein n=1 Tax=Nyssa sinensis TaxID=561372 RepID=A0A5J5C397_9ASTE|nr:hypothetical protein F0562_000066 [Nyssa sinensis]